jgi:hypothetical protein
LGTPESRAEIATMLREEARDLLAQTGIFALLEDRFGQPSVTGSAGYDLMVWRDIDIDLAIDADRRADWMAFGSDISAQLESVGLTLGRATYTNGYVEPTPMGGGLSWSIGFTDFAGNPWQVDIFGWDPFDYAVRQARDFALKTDLTGLNRDMILRLKTELREREAYGPGKLSTWDVYQFLIAKGGDSFRALEAWKGRGPRSVPPAGS